MINRQGCVLCHQRDIPPGRKNLIIWQFNQHPAVFLGGKDHILPCLHVFLHHDIAVLIFGGDVFTGFNISIQRQRPMLNSDSNICRFNITVYRSVAVSGTYENPLSGRYLAANGYIFRFTVYIHILSRVYIAI